jgi:hypothetical protein
MGLADQGGAGARHRKGDQPVLGLQVERISLFFVQHCVSSHVYKYGAAPGRERAAGGDALKHLVVIL